MEEEEEGEPRLFRPCLMVHADHQPTFVFLEEVEVGEVRVEQNLAFAAGAEAAGAVEVEVAPRLRKLLCDFPWIESSHRFPCRFLQFLHHA